MELWSLLASIVYKVLTPKKRAAGKKNNPAKKIKWFPPASVGAGLKVISNKAAGGGLAG